MPVIELRQYRLHPGGRDTLIRLFEAELVEAQERCGMRILGTFRDLDDPQRFVWIRSFVDMETRERALGEFYGGPVWRRHRDVANATMIDSDDVLLLRAGWGEAGPATDGAGADERGIVEAWIAPLGGPAGTAQLTYFCDEVVPPLQRAGGAPLACLVSEPAVNTFPALPVREGENVLVWLAGYSQLPAAEARVESGRAVSRMPGLAAPPTVLRLAPTEGSRLTGTSTSTFAPVRTLARGAPRD